MLKSRIVGCGAYLPDKVLTNAELSQTVETSDEWIVKRTGIRERRIAADGQLTSDLAVKAAQQCLQNSGMTAEDVDLVVVATTTPDQTFPATAARVQAKLGMTRGAAFDIQAVCTGFLYALSVADAQILAGRAKTVLVIGAETFSRIVDWTDRGTCVLFGDGAGAVLLQADETTGAGVLDVKLYSDGTLADLLYADGGPSSSKMVGTVKMHGREIFRLAVDKLSQAVNGVLESQGASIADVNWIVPHQANRRIIDAVADKLSVPIDRFVLTVDRHGNTSAASVPMALAEAVADGRIKRGDLILLEAIGGGLTWGAALLRW